MSPANNFPRFKPIVHYDPTLVPDAAQPMIQRSSKLRLLTFASFTVNLAASIALLASGVPEYASVGGLILGIIYFILWPVLEFFTAHLSLYKAALTDSSLRYVLYFVLEGIDVAFKVFILVGIKDAGSGGIGAAIAMFNANSIIAGVLCILNSIVLGANTLLLLFLLRAAFVFYRRGGHSLQQARGEAFTAAAKNETIRKAAVSHTVNTLV